MDISLFRKELEQNLQKLGDNITYNQFENIFMRQLDKHAPMKEKYIRANNTPFMNKKINKAIMNRSRLTFRLEWCFLVCRPERGGGVFATGALKAYIS